MAVFENRQPLAAAKFIIKSFFACYCPAFFQWLELMLHNKSNVEFMSVPPPLLPNRLLVAVSVNLVFIILQ
jgi:hypothetical protein